MKYWAFQKERLYTLNVYNVVNILIMKYLNIFYFLYFIQSEPSVRFKPFFLLFLSFCWSAYIHSRNQACVLIYSFNKQSVQENLGSNNFQYFATSPLLLLSIRRWPANMTNCTVSHCSENFRRSKQQYISKEWVAVQFFFQDPVPEAISRGSPALLSDSHKLPVES